MNWQQLSAPNQMIVFYMGLSGLDKICQSLIENGCSENHPIAIIQQGIISNQRVITGTFESLPHIVMKQGVKAPTLIIVGTVVELHNKLG